MLTIKRVPAGYPLGLGVVTANPEYALIEDGEVITTCDDLDLLIEITFKIEESQ